MLSAAVVLLARMYDEFCRAPCRDKLQIEKKKKQNTHPLIFSPEEGILLLMKLRKCTKAADGNQSLG